MNKKRLKWLRQQVTEDTCNLHPFTCRYCLHYENDRWTDGVCRKGPQRARDRGDHKPYASIMYITQPENAGCAYWEHYTDHDEIYYKIHDQLRWKPKGEWNE